MDYRFPKTERLKSSKKIEKLFSKGKTFTKYPLKIFFFSEPIQSEANENFKNNLIAFAVPKRSFKLAVDRNRIKRQLRETYRLNKHLLPKNEDKRYTMLFLFLGKDKLPYAQLEKAMVGILTKLRNEHT
ncbi:ribonuclease P protein component [Aequorivita sp. H23M31]|uniref:Ribonuclease P protein component n=1 Tax=Aequorivita ciconiae TaxID=2494375 RepID=A0A410G4U5_9FLAO|nr:ribonuclease P protein component [Aequorivita sp. H23M31]QAA82280.1 ribonuclease P protein component [Aequorivita sp. H23M31]